MTSCDFWHHTMIFNSQSLVPRETKLTVLRGTSLQVICYEAENFEAGNSLNVAVTAAVC